MYPPERRETTEAVPEIAGYALLPHPMKEVETTDEEDDELDELEDDELTLSPRPDELSAKAIADPLSAAYF